MKTLESHLFLDFFAKIWKRYSFFIIRNMYDNQSLLEPDEYFKFRFFVQIIKYVIPLGTISLLCHLIVSMHLGNYVPITIESLTFALFIATCINKRLALQKKIFCCILITYAITVIKIVSLSSLASGSIFTFSLTLFTTTLISKPQTYLLVAINTFLYMICSSFISNHAETSTLSSFMSHLINERTSYILNLTFINLICIHFLSYLIATFKNSLFRRNRLYIKLRTEVQQKIASELLLRESIIHYRSLFNDNPLPMVIFDPTSLVFLRVNNCAKEHYGYSEEEFLQMKATRILRWDEQTFKKERVKNHLTQIYKHYTKDGDAILVDVKASDIILNDSPARLAIIRDITKETKHVETIEQQNQTLREIAHLQSHTIRSPICKILGITELLADYPRDESEWAVLISNLMSSTQELDIIVRDIIKKTENQ